VAQGEARGDERIHRNWPALDRPGDPDDQRNDQQDPDDRPDQTFVHGLTRVLEKVVVTTGAVGASPA
jgi:hypothetical protein